MTLSTCSEQRNRSVRSFRTTSITHPTSSRLTTIIGGLLNGCIAISKLLLIFQHNHLSKLMTRKFHPLKSRKSIMLWRRCENSSKRNMRNCRRSLMSPNLLWMTVRTCMTVNLRMKYLYLIKRPQKCLNRTPHPSHFCSNFGHLSNAPGKPLKVKDAERLLSRSLRAKILLAGRMILLRSMIQLAPKVVIFMIWRVFTHSPLKAPTNHIRDHLSSIIPQFGMVRTQCILRGTICLINSWRRMLPHSFILILRLTLKHT